MLNPMTETTSPARLIQSLTLIVAGSSVLIIEEGKGNVYLVAPPPDALYRT
jgi:hypothetical protein